MCLQAWLPVLPGEEWSPSCPLLGKGWLLGPWGQEDSLEDSMGRERPWRQVSKALKVGRGWRAGLCLPLCALTESTLGQHCAHAHFTGVEREAWGQGGERRSGGGA